MNKQNRRLVIVGAGGHGKVVADCAERMGRWSEIVFADSNFPTKQHCLGFSVVCHPDNIESVITESTDAFVAVGDNHARKRIAQSLPIPHERLVSLVHPNAVVSRYVKIGQGVLILAGAVINADTAIEDGSIVNTCASVDHDCVVGAYSHLAPGVHLAGAVDVGQECFLGVGVSVIPKVTIGTNTIVGAGATVIQNLPANITAIGTPAKQK
ncbi:acetyltransferase [Aestuariibacter sp. AA17]|uniref:Acetyltransferase n=1 Tax=Fluctibacter corallii TaxID=2984329 RepID=A0ABT3ADC7_9ALTE|nr:acetyltransferase [Aestuariibacter sp. AA17]MCV2886684.1 acetyltransferase [Aestuariibacter sp. AA17]